MLVGDHVKRGPRGIDLQITRPFLPAPQDDHPRVGGGIVHGAVDVADDHEVGQAAEAGRVRAEDREVAVFVRCQTARVLAFEKLIEQTATVREAFEGVRNSRLSIQAFQLLRAPSRWP